MGDHSSLTPELTMQIRLGVVQGKEYKTICEELAIPIGTWDSWTYRDTQGFRANLVRWKAERFLKLAQDNVPTLLTTAKSERVKADMTKFILETAGKEIYHKKTEVDLDPTKMTDEQLASAITNSLAALGITDISQLIGRTGPKSEGQSDQKHEGVRETATADNGTGEDTFVLGREQNGQDGVGSA